MAAQPNYICLRRLRNPRTEIPRYTLIEGQLHFDQMADPILDQMVPRNPTSIYVCATCHYRQNRQTFRGGPGLHTQGISQIHLPGFLSWVNDGDDAAGVNLNPLFITRFAQPVTRVIDSHMDLDQGGSSVFGERVPFDEFGNQPEDEVLIVPLFCDYCHDRVGFQMLRSPYGVEDVWEAPLLDMGTVLEID